MNYIGRLLGNVREFYNEINSATLTGAIDVIAIRAPDGGAIHASPFHVRFGKASVLHSREKVVDIEVNGEPVELKMKLGEGGEAFFVDEVELDAPDFPDNLATSPIPSSSSDAMEIMRSGVEQLRITTAGQNPSQITRTSTTVTISGAATGGQNLSAGGGQSSASRDASKSRSSSPGDVNDQLLMPESSGLQRSMSDQVFKFDHLVPPKSSFDDGSLVNNKQQDKSPKKGKNPSSSKSAESGVAAVGSSGNRLRRERAMALRHKRTVSTSQHYSGGLTRCNSSPLPLSSTQRTVLESDQFGLYAHRKYSQQPGKGHHLYGGKYSKPSNRRNNRSTGGGTSAPMKQVIIKSSLPTSRPNRLAAIKSSTNNSSSTPAFGGKLRSSPSKNNRKKQSSSSSSTNNRPNQSSDQQQQLRDDDNIFELDELDEIPTAKTQRTSASTNSETDDSDLEIRDIEELDKSTSGRLYSHSLPSPIPMELSRRRPTLTIHPFSDTDITPNASPSSSRPGTPGMSGFKSDSELDRIARDESSNINNFCGDAEALDTEWKWGELPDKTPTQEHPPNSITYAEETSMKSATENSGVAGNNSNASPGSASGATEAGGGNWGWISGFNQFMRQTKKVRHQPQSEGIYLDELIKTKTIDPTTAALYFPKSREDKIRSRANSTTNINASTPNALEEQDSSHGIEPNRSSPCMIVDNHDPPAATHVYPAALLDNPRERHGSPTGGRDGGYGSSQSSVHGGELGGSSNAQAAAATLLQTAAGSDKGSAAPSAGAAFMFDEEKVRDAVEDFAMSSCSKRVRNSDLDSLREFEENIISYETMNSNPAILFDPKLVVRMNGKYYSGKVAMPMLVSMIAFNKPLSKDAVAALHETDDDADDVKETEDDDENESEKGKLGGGTTTTTTTSSSSSDHMLSVQILDDQPTHSIAAAGAESSKKTAVDEDKPVPSAAVVIKEPTQTAVATPTTDSTTTPRGGSWFYWSRGVSVEPPKTPTGVDDASPAADGNFSDAGGSYPSDCESNDGNFEDGRRFKKVLRLTSAQLATLNLKNGSNEIRFSVTTKLQGTASCTCHLFLWNHDDKIVISDIDGTITKSDVLGQILPVIGGQWAQAGVARLYCRLIDNGYKIMYLSARAIGQSGMTKDYLRSLQQEQFMLPEGPLLLSPASLLSALHREVIEKKPEEFKKSCLNDILALFPSGVNPLYAGFGNKINDVWAYQAVGVPLSKIFTINHKGELRHENVRGLTSSYVAMNESFVDHYFPSLSKTHHSAPLQSSFPNPEQFSKFTYWRHFDESHMINLDTSQFPPSSPSPAATSTTSNPKPSSSLTPTQSPVASDNKPTSAASKPTKSSDESKISGAGSPADAVSSSARDGGTDDTSKTTAYSSSTTAADAGAGAGAANNNKNSSAIDPSSSSSAPSKRSKSVSSQSTSTN